MEPGSSHPSIAALRSFTTIVKELTDQGEGSSEELIKNFGFSEPILSSITPTLDNLFLGLGLLMKLFPRTDLGLSCVDIDIIEFLGIPLSELQRGQAGS